MGRPVGVSIAFRRFRSYRRLSRFPSAPFIDFFYFARMLRIGGILAVDDIQIWTGRVLTDFLTAEGAWQPVEVVGKTSLFKKLADVEGPQWEFIHQPYVLRRSRATLAARAGQTADLARRATRHLLRGDLDKLKKGFRSLFAR